MRKLSILAIVCALSLGLGAVSVQAINLTVDNSATNANYLGQINPGIPPDQVDQVGYLNFLLGMNTPSTASKDDAGNDTGQNYIRSSLSECGPHGTCSSITAVLPGWRDETGSNTVDLGTGGYLFLIGKYGGGQPDGQSIVWYVGNLSGVITIDATAPNTKGLSNWTLYNRVSVPDGGMTLMLLGGALLGLEGLRRRLKV